jgi:hypothetical protein
MNTPLRRAATLALFSTLSAFSTVGAAQGFAPDAQGDFLATYSGPHNGDLDVLFAYGLWNPGTQMFSFGGVLSAPVGTTAGALYVWGIDRGTGTERLAAGSPSVGQGVFFDSVISLNPSAGAYSVNLLNGTVFTLAASSVSIVANTITVNVPLADLPGMGRTPDQYGWNLWPRFGAGNTAISDFAPDASTPRVASVVPEPASWALMASGGAVLLGLARRRRA